MTGRGLPGWLIAAGLATISLGRAGAETLPSGNVLFWPEAQKAAGFRHMEAIFPTATVKAGARVHALPRAPGAFDVRYTLDGRAMTTGRFMQANRVAGLLVLRDGRILAERYRLGLTRSGRWTSFSVAKSITSTLVGAAIRDGAIKSVDDPITTYVPRLKGSAYDGATIRDLLTMSAGVRWNEDYTDPNSDAARLKAFDHDARYDVVDYMAGLPRATEPGKAWHYRTGDSHLLGIAVANATGMPLSDYLSKVIWQPYGMQQDAYWVTSHGTVLGGSYLSMSLRDFGRFGQFFLDGGRAGGRPVLPEGWTTQATRPLYATDLPGIGYGYQWWVDGGDYAAIGIFGQTIRVDPAKRLVIVVLSAWPQATVAKNYRELGAFVAAVERAVR
jgi:CubicO group peptidase (beta-lactamase class C family)